MDSMLSMLPWLLASVVMAWPFVRIAKRVGLSPWWAALVIIPGGFLVALYVLAFVKGKAQ